jgi:hypothetical protein
MILKLNLLQKCCGNAKWKKIKLGSTIILFLGKFGLKPFVRKPNMGYSYSKINFYSF